MHRLVQPHRVRVPELRVHGDRRPLFTAVGAGEHEHAVRGRLRVHVLLRYERRRAADQLAGGRVEHVDESGLPGFDYGLLAAYHGDHGRADCVQVPHVVRHLLKAPLELPVGRVDRGDRLGPAVVARTDRAVQVGGRVADRDEQRLARLVIRRRHPHPPASGPSPTLTAHFSLPVAASSATSSSSSVPRKTEPPATATPRLFGPQHAVLTDAFLCSYCHSIFWVRRSNARTMLLGVAGEVMYIVPLTTIGVVSKLPSVVDP